MRSLILFDPSLSKKICLYDALAYLLCLLLLFSCATCGPGRFIVIHGVTPRMLIFGGILIFSLPLLFRDRKNLARNVLMLSWCAFFVYMLISAVRGHLLGNNSAVLTSDVKGFLYFLMMPAFVCVFRNRERIETGMRVVILGSSFLSLFLCIIALFHNLNVPFLSWFSKLNHANFLFVNYVSPEIVRLFSPSTPYMVAAVCFSVYFQCRDEKIRWYYVAATVFALLAILLSFTRSIYLAFCSSILLSVILALIAGYGRTLAKHLLLSFVFVAVLLAGFYVVFGANFLGFAYDRTIGNTFISENVQNSDDQDNDSAATNDGNTTTGSNGEEAKTEESGNLNEDILDAIDQPNSYIDTSKDSSAQVDAYLGYSKIVSDAYRQYTLKAMTAKIKNAPVFGHGLGTTIKYRDYNEYFYLDVLMKMGILGLLLYLLPAILGGFWFFRKIRYLRGEPPQRKGMLLIGSVVAGFFGICVFSFFNPYLNAVLGETMYCLGISAVFLLQIGEHPTKIDKNNV